RASANHIAARDGSPPIRPADIPSAAASEADTPLHNPKPKPIHIILNCRHTTQLLKATTQCGSNSPRPLPTMLRHWPLSPPASPRVLPKPLAKAHGHTPAPKRACFSLSRPAEFTSRASAAN